MSIQHPKYFFVLLLATFTCCTQTNESENKQTWQHTYHVKGVIVRGPKNDKEPREVLIRHEAIDNFINSSGNVEPMRSMTMPFPLSKQITFEDFKEGDEIEFVYQMNWSPNPKEEVSSMTTLPKGTVHF